MKERISVNPRVITVAITALCLVPFAGKAFHVDDTVFLAAAKHIQHDPVSFYGSSINWFGRDTPMTEVNKNPPLTCYYIALVAKFFGWSEVALHLAFLVPAVAVALGSFYLAKQFCSKPMLAAMAGVLTPVFLVSSTNVMCDTMMLTFWVWAAFTWVWGMDEKKWYGLLISTVFIAACALTKYFGVSLILLLFVYSLMKKRKIGTWVLYLLVSVAILALYQWATFKLYGRGLLADAASTATKWNLEYGVQLSWKVLVGLAFTGGGITTLLFYAPLLWSRRILISGAVLMILFMFAIVSVGRISGFSIRTGNVVRSNVLIQFGLMSLTGLGVLWLAVADLYKCRDCKSLLLFLWVLGTFFFTAFVNWGVNERSVLPMTPAVGILLARAIDRRGETGRAIGNWQVRWPLILTAIIALSVCWADYTLAGTAREAAKTICETYKNRRPTTLWFMGHWGFQHYMEAYKARALDRKIPWPAAGDIIVIPENNTGQMPMPEGRTSMVQVFEFVPCRWLSTMSNSLGAGFYADAWGPLPFAFGRVPVEKYYIFVSR
ncbi:MAG: glycosyltransferase family 39 protein [Sedimentisphaerales bacterium]|nr:glycosyltransferase family 39 protein [Sedimentisphaerales bacterium]